MSFTRRTFLQFLSLALLLRHPSWLFARQTPPDWENTLTVFLDTLMPADESPAASTLEVDHRLVQLAENDGGYRRMLQNGCQWLELAARREYRTGFTALTETQRIRIVELMEQTRSGTPAQVFFARVQYDLFEYYYSQPASWTGLGIDQPPQPAGYTGYADPPDSGS